MLRFELHTLGWYSFEELCRTILREEWRQPVEAYSRGPDGGRDGFLFGSWSAGEAQSPSILQCKHRGTEGERLQPSDLRPELTKVALHAQAGRCDTYVLMTNAQVSGDTAAAIEAAIRETGVNQVIVQGYEAICEMLTSNASLRALVPRLYGLGDLTEILDERHYLQAEAILAAMHDDLASLVPVEAHRQAYRALKAHHFALLLGRPGSGKSSIAASLAIAAADQFDARPVTLTSIGELAERWNPGDPNQFFWLDDGFGATQYEHAEAQAWNKATRAISAALKRGARLIVTSRDYVYAAARPDLKRGDFTLLDESQVLIEVEAFTRTEREQILYNHLKLGRQPTSTLQRASPADLEAFAADSSFLPELARRLADPAFTKQVRFWDSNSLLNFCRQPRAMLFELLETLDGASRAALGLVHLNGNHLSSPYVASQRNDDFLARLGFETGETLRALQALKGSLVRLVSAGGERWWQFHHPTLSSAYERWLAEHPELLAEYVASSDLNVLLRTVTCGEVGIEGAIVVPGRLYDAVADRILSALPHRRQGIIVSWDPVQSSFLARRCDESFLRSIVTKEPRIIEKTFDIGLYVNAYEHHLPLVHRLVELRLVDLKKRRELIETLIAYAAERIDGSFLGDDDWLSLFSPRELAGLDAAVLEGLDRLDDAIEEHLRESEGDVGTAKDLVQGYASRYGGHPGVEAAVASIRAFESWEPDADQASSWLEDAAEDDSAPAEVTQAALAPASLFDDLVG